jgi:hypothetical protein
MFIMKVLFPINLRKQRKGFLKDLTGDNPFVITLCHGLEREGCDITCSTQELFDNWKSYDIIHFQWPHVLAKCCNDISKISQLISDIKKGGKKIIVTIHNIEPHYSDNALIHSLYELIYGSADVLVHMGDYSKNLFEKKYPHARNIIIPHHIYDEIYNGQRLPEREEAIKKLNLNNKYRYIVCFGSFRNEEEIEVANTVANRLYDEGIRVLAPGLARIKITKNIIKTFKSYINYKRITSKYPKIVCNGRYVPDSMVPYYYAASDIALIQRKRILNSGNMPMALLMKKVVVGPNVGNVGCLLQELSNPTFDVNSIDSVETAVRKALELSSKGKGIDNYNYAKSICSTKVVCKKYYEAYLNMLNIDSYEKRV